jgi:ERCC4-type nuclease
MQRLEFVLLIDRREKSPLRFGEDATEWTTLRYGDYSIRASNGNGEPHDFRNEIALERKSLPDLYASCSLGRDRFENELRALATFERAAIVIEGSMAAIMMGIPHSRVHPNSVLGSLCSWFAQFDVAPIFCDSPETAARAVRKILTRYAALKLVDLPRDDPDLRLDEAEHRIRKAIATVQRKAPEAVEEVERLKRELE